MSGSDRDQALQHREVLAVEVAFADGLDEAQQGADEGPILDWHGLAVEGFGRESVTGQCLDRSNGAAPVEEELAEEEQIT